MSPHELEMLAKSREAANCISEISKASSKDNMSAFFAVALLDELSNQVQETSDSITHEKHPARSIPHSSHNELLFRADAQAKTLGKIIGRHIAPENRLAFYTELLDHLQKTLAEEPERTLRVFETGLVEGIKNAR